jgi:hypothetical protein
VPFMAGCSPPSAPSRRKCPRLPNPGCMGFVLRAPFPLLGASRRCGGARCSMCFPKDEACLQAVSFHRLANPETSVCEVWWLRPERPSHGQPGCLACSR